MTTILVTGPLPDGGSEWEFQGIGSTGPENGKFLTDADSAQQTSKLYFANLNAAGSDSLWIAKVTVGSLVVFEDTTGRTASFTMQNVDNDDLIELEVLWVSGELDWSGKYHLQFPPRT